MTVHFDTIRKVHFVGIGGIGMSALARYFVATGKQVTGSDTTPTALTQELIQEGVSVHIGHDEQHIEKGTNLIIYTHAIPAGNPELAYGRKMKIPLLTYAQALGIVTKEKFTIAVAGTHGKSTTTAMIALNMERAGLDPTVIIGTKIREFGNSNFRYGRSNFLLIEACEYRRSFLEYYPHMLIVPNIDIDHLDYFKDEEDYVSAFKALFKKIPESGYVIANGDDDHIDDIAEIVKGHFVGVHFLRDGFMMDDQKYDFPPMQIPGRHNRINASLAFMTGKLLDIPEDTIRETLGQFTGTWRRFEYKGMMETGAQMYDDYGHHPTEIRATLSGAREQFPNKKITCVFQPHQYSRTRSFLKEFGRSFEQADLVIIPNIYEARDGQQDLTAVDDLVLEIQGNGVAVFNGEGLGKTADYLKQHTSTEDVVITMGAGDIHEVYSFLSMQKD
jgi:UDP-N-acetylmuramate--alanine ligase